MIEIKKVVVVMKMLWTMVKKVNGVSMKETKKRSEIEK